MADLPEGVTDTFYSPCLECGETVYTVGGTRQEHFCDPVESTREAIARAYWNGHQAGSAGAS